MLGNAVFTGYQALKSKLTNNGEDSGEDKPPEDWSEAPEPAQVGQRIAEGVFQADLDPARHASVLTNITHWIYGTSWGALYGAVQESWRPHPLVHGAALGGIVTATDYTLLPLMNIYEPPWRYPTTTLAKDLGNHLVYGLAVAGAYRVLDQLVDGRR